MGEINMPSFHFHVRNQSRCGSFFMQKSMHEIFHPNNSQVLQNHWANESPAWWWYLVLTSSGLIVKGRFVTCAGCWGVVYPLLAPGQNQNIIICVWFSELESILFCSKLGLGTRFKLFFCLFAFSFAGSLFNIAFQHALVSTNEMKMQCALVSAIEMKIMVGKRCLF
jgi:hypothetical protein